MCHRLGQKLRHLQQGICNHGHVNVGAIIPSNTSNPQHMLGSSYNDPSIEVWTNIYLVCCAHSSSNNMPELIGGRMPFELLTFEGKRQAKAVGHYFLSHGLQFDAIFTSPLERSKQTAFHVCQVYIRMLFFYFSSCIQPLQCMHMLSTHTHALMHSYNHFVVECICLNV